MEKTCLKCGTVSQVEESRAAACHNCGAIYAKVEAMSAAGLLEASGTTSRDTRSRQSSQTKTPEIKIAIAVAVGMLLFGIAWLGNDWREYQRARAELKQLEVQALERQSHWGKDPRVIFPPGSVFDNGQFVALLDKHYPNAQYKPNKTILVKFQDEKWVIKTAKAAESIPPPYRILDVVPMSEVPLCDDVKVGSLRGGASMAEATRLTSEAYERGDCRRWG